MDDIKDEASFFGLRQYQRVSFTKGTDHFKAGVLIHKANHGQFNSIWGRRDFGEPYGWFLNTGALLEGHEQRQAAKVFISAFVERIFNKQPYDEIFERPYLVKDWLPETAFLGNYQNSSSDLIVDFESGIDIKNKSRTIHSANNLAIWREEQLQMRGGDNQGTNTVILGWDQENVDGVPSYEIELRDSVLLAIDQDFIMSIGRGKDKSIETDGTEQVDVKIELETTSGIYSFNLSDQKVLAPLLKVKYMKLGKMNSSFGTEWELNMETVAFPLSLPTDKDSYLKKLRFSFDQSPKGLVAIDNIGLRKTIHSSMK